VVEVSPAGGKSPQIELLLGGKIASYVVEHSLGEVTGAEGGYWLQPGTMRAPDIGFYGWDKYQQITKPTGFRPFPPDLAVEVVSPSDQAEDIQNKVRLYIESGVQQVWVIYPEAQEAMCYYPDHTARRLTVDDTLDGGDVLPGFTLPLAACFPPDPPAENDTSPDESSAS
jgi:Uma2 family endonuclease